MDSRSTYDLTEMFYANLAKGWPLDIALQKAKLSFMQAETGENELPYHWAAPILVGRDDPIRLEGSFQWPYAATAAGIALILLIGLQWKKRNKPFSRARGKAGIVS